MSAVDIEQLLQDIPLQQPRMWMQPTSSHRANTFRRNTSVNTVTTLRSCKI